MRRSVFYAAGLMVAAGASLAIAGPAAAAPDYKPRPGTYLAGSPVGNLVSQNLVQTNVTTQVALSNIGNVQIGDHNYMGASTAVNNAVTGQGADFSGFRYR